MNARFHQFLLIAIMIISSSAHGQEDWDTLFHETFDHGYEESWNLEEAWILKQEGQNGYLSGKGSTWAQINKGYGWTDYELQADIRIRKGNFHLNFRVDDRVHFYRYFLGVEPSGLYLEKQARDDFSSIAAAASEIATDTWHTIKIVVIEKTIQIHVDDELLIQEYDQEALTHGKFSFELFDESEIEFDNILVTGKNQEKPKEGYNWYRTGGPIGGLGYDIRIHPGNKDIMYVTDNPSGVNKSTDGGKTWKQKNSGIDQYSWADGSIPIFSITIDPNNPDILWSGTQNAKGIFKSLDGGENWLKKDQGVSEGGEISFRGFAIHPENSDIVLAAAEIATTQQGIEFGKSKGKIYKTIDGGENWYAVWEGDNLARVLIYNYRHPDTVYCSTGIFDVEAANSQIQNGVMGGVGVLRSYDAGETWHAANKGLDHLYIGFLEMHPSDPDILFAAASNNATSYPPNNKFGGFYRTKDGGDNWEKVYSSQESHEVITASPSDPEIVYAIGTNVYRSQDGGTQWVKMNQGNRWGPPGIAPGFVISTVVDPVNPDIVWVNNYGGGNFVSKDGGKTWNNSSNGYTGARIRDMEIHPLNPNFCFLASRTGPFVTHNGGVDWTGINYLNNLGDSYSIAVFPDKPDDLLASTDWSGAMLKSTNGGSYWKEVFAHPEVHPSDPAKRHGFRDIQIAPSDPRVVYGGMGRVTNVGMTNPSPEPSFGMYKSTDRGESWFQINNGLPSSAMTINTIAIHPGNPDIVFIGTSLEGIHTSIDGGQTWNALNDGLSFSDVRSIAIDPQDPRIMYAGSGDGNGLAKTTSGGAVWGTANKGMTLDCPTYFSSFGRVAEGMDLTGPPAPSSTGNYAVPWTKILDIVIDPHNPKNVYAADANMGVYFSENQGESWAAITEGLGISTVTSLTISADGKVLYCGTEGAGVHRLTLENKAPLIYSRIPTTENITIFHGDSLLLDIFTSDLNNDTLKYTWMINHAEAADAQSSTFLFESVRLDTGYYDVSAIVSDDSLSSNTSWIIHVIPLATASPDNSKPERLSIYPNPFADQLSLSLSLADEARVKITLLDLNSRILGSVDDLYYSKGSHTLALDIHGLNLQSVSSGTYILRTDIDYGHSKARHESKIIRME